MNHWSTPYLGKPYEQGAQGPDSYNCWGLVRGVLRDVCDLELPLVHIKHHIAQENEIREVARISNFRPQPAHTQLADFDVVLMWGPFGRHIAIGLRLDGNPYALHSVENLGVVITPFPDLWMMGYSGVTLWRRA